MGKKPGLVIPLFALFLFIYLLAWGVAARRRSVHWNNLAGVAGLGAIGLLGFLVTHYHTAKVRPDNLLHQPGQVSHYVGVVEEYLSEKPGTVATTLSLWRVQADGRWRTVSGKVRLTIARKKGYRPLQYGDVLLVKGAPVPVKPPANPGQFDYRQYLAHQQVYHQHYRNPGQYLKIGAGQANPLVAASIRTRDYLDQALRKNIPSAREYGVATALVLGIKEHLPEDLKTTYAHTGTMHVLAVSGLHVALLFYLLQVLVGRWSQGRLLRPASYLLLLLIIWFYAFVTALSASVLRAVLMFSLLHTAKTFRLPGNIYNTLAAAAFGLLVYDPYFLVDVGFQLSFLAVYGIVYLQARIYRRLQFDNWPGDQLWKLVSTSLAAQLAVLPLSFYYFHQFPVYFLAANVVAVTLSNAALLLGFALLALSGVAVLAQALGWLIAALLQLMNGFSEALLRLPGAVISGIVLSPVQAWLLYGLLLLGLLFLARRRLVYFAGFTVLLLWFSGLELAAARQRQQQALFVVYQVRGATALAFIRQGRATLLADSAFYAQPRHYRYVVQPHWWQLGVDQVQLDTLSGRRVRSLASVGLADGNVLIGWQGIRVLVCHRRRLAHHLSYLNPDYLVLTQKVKFRLESIPNKKDRLWVIMEGPGNNWHQKQWAAQLEARRLRVYQLNRQGAYIRVVD